MATLGVATISRLRYDYAAAEAAYQQLLDAGAGLPDAWAAAAHLGRANVALNQGRFRAAESPLAAALARAEAAGDSALVGEVLLTLGGVLSRTRSAAAAESLFARARGFVAAGGPVLEARFRCIQSLFTLRPASRAEERQRVEQELEAAADQAARAGGRRVQAGCLLSLANLAMTRGGAAPAVFALLDRAVDLYAAARDQGGLAVTLQRRGWYFSTLGQYGYALTSLRRAIAHAEISRDGSALAWSLANLATIALKAGDHAEARSAWARAAEWFTGLGDEVGLATAIGGRGDLARAAGALDSAEKGYREALERRQRFGDVIGELGLRRALAEIALARRNPDAAERELGAALAVARARSLEGWERGLQRLTADIALARGDLDLAHRLLSEARGGEALYRRYVTGVRIAEIEVRRGRIDRAAAELAAAADTLDAWRSRHLSLRDLREAAFQIGENPLDPDLGVATVIGALSTGGRVSEAFAQAERRRARELLDQLNRAEAFADRLPDSARTRARAQRAPLGLEEFRALLPEGMALLQYVTGRGGEATVAFAVTRAAAVAHRLAPIDTLDPEIARTAALAAAGTLPGPLAARLGRQLLSAVDSLPRHVDHLVIVPDDALHRVPFDALTTGNGQALLDRLVVSVAPSATVLARLMARPRRPAGPAAVLVLADPAFSASDPTSESGGLVDAFRAAGGLPRLRESGREADAVRRLSPATTVRRRADASEAFLKQADLGGYRILHFATHAVVDEQAVNRTALALAPGGGEDGLVRPSDLAALELDADLVVLSACRTAGGLVVRGEGVQGMAAPLLEAGARSVVATGWRVGDRGARRLMEDFYRALGSGAAVGEALRSAKRAARDRGAPTRDWAAFTVIGDPTVRLVSAR